MLTFESPEQLRSEPLVRQFWLVAVLMALRDKAERVEVRFTEEGGLLYHRVQGRDWELTPVSDEIFPELKSELRSVARLIHPERPDFMVTSGFGEARYEPPEIGWLTLQLQGRLYDLAVRIDPQEPWGSIILEIENPDLLAGLAAEALAGYYEAGDDPETE